MEITKPIIIIGAPRSGTTLLFSILSSHPQVWSLYRESDIVFNKFFPPSQMDWKRGNSLDESDFDSTVANAIHHTFYQQAINYQLWNPEQYTRVLTNPIYERIMRRLHYHLIAPFFRPKTIRLVEKSPKNCLRLPFLYQLFPDALYVYIKRDPKTNISSLINGWRTPNRFHTYDVPGGVEIEGYNESYWKFLLPPGWQQYTHGQILAKVCSFQYRVANETVLDALEKFPSEQQIHIKYENLIDNSEEVIKEICRKADLSYIGALKHMVEELPPVNFGKPPDPNKWKQNADEINVIQSEIEAISIRMGYGI